MSEMNFPPAGTKCRDCGCCDATVYAGNDPICWDCDTGNLCPGRKRAKTAEARVIDVPAIRLEPVAAAAKCEVKEEKPVNTSGKSGGRIPEEIRIKILAEPVSESNREIGEKYGIKEGAVWYIRNKAGIHSAAVGGPRKTATARRDLHPARVKQHHTPRAIEKQHTNGHVPAPVHVVADSRKIAVTVQIDEPSADAFWHALSLEQKAASIELQMQAILDRGVAARA
jgi:hypothetical protein